ncbi:MAG: Rpp14/Pop5 family protein [Methanoregula sp.]|nr:MAG: Rpp14/Pop5 family protein [Methanoregula sp.]
MTARPPTLREKRRYVLTRIEPAGTAPDPKEMYYSVYEAVTSLWGDAAGALIHVAVIAVEGDYVIVRCRRGAERELAIALSTVTSCGGKRVALRSVAASGTIESLRERISEFKDKAQVPGVPSECTIDGMAFSVCHCAGQKIDVIEKGFKNTTRFFLTREDLEDS